MRDWIARHPIISILLLIAAVSTALVFIVAVTYTGTLVFGPPRLLR